MDKQFQVEMALYDQRMSQAVLAAQRMEARIASEQMEGIVQAPVVNRGIVQAPVVDEKTGYSTSDSELSTVSSSRFSGLEEDWWKEKTPGAARAAASGATVTIVRTRSKSKRVHWE